MFGEGVEVCEGVKWVLQVWCPLLRGHGAAAQVQATHRRRQSQFTDAQESPGRQQVCIAFSEEAQDPPHQKIQDQGEENNL